MAEDQKLKIEDLHPVLQMIFEIGCEVEAAMSGCIKKQGQGKTALNLTDAVEENYNKVDHYEHHADPFTGQKFKTEVYVQEQFWRVHFAVEKNGKVGRGCCSSRLENVTQESQGLKQLAVIATDLQKVYGLPYTPAIYRNGKPVQ